MFIRRILAVLLFTALFAGCSMEITKKKEQERQFYILEPKDVAAVASAKQYGTLQVRRFRISPSFAAREIVIRTGENTFLADYYNLFLVPPSDLVTRVVRGKLSASTLFEYVVGQDSPIQHDYSLEGSVTSLYGDFSSGDSPMAVVEIRTFLIGRPEESRILAAHDFRREIPIDVKTIDGLVEAYNTALTEYLGELDVFLAETLRQMK